MEEASIKELATVMIGWVYYLLTFVALIIALLAVFDILRSKPQDFVRADKRTYQFWLAVCGASAVFLGLSLFAGFNFVGFAFLLTIAAVVACGVYLADVKPALQYYRRG